MGPAMYPPSGNTQRPIFQGDVSQMKMKVNNLRGGYAKAYNEKYTLPSAQSNTGAILVLPEQMGQYSDVISRWESITLNLVNERTWIDNKAKICFIENLLGENEKKMWIQWRMTYPADEGELDNASMVFQEIKENGLTPDAHSYSILIDGFCKNGDLSNGFKLLEKMSSSGVMPTMVSYSSLLHGLCLGGEMGLALSIFNWLSSQGYTHDLVSYGILIDGYCQLGDLDGASRLWQEMIKNGFVPDAYSYTSIIFAHCKNGCLEVALDKFKSMLCNGVMPTVVTCTMIVDGYCKQHRIVEAFAFLNAMQEQGIIPNIMYKVILNGLQGGKI
ncbi:pentatricopeptide repeat-containing protein [Canna indica]|uniref:Pentatricopeptide repeat-containing protein n=1 Tax=Canna indica TaxID=4628 RepID=A0AAQ3PYE5_9LILI|nr:pentatricopeptide repeat-containing protein [Canna indica]